MNKITQSTRTKTRNRMHHQTLVAFQKCKMYADFAQAEIRQVPKASSKPYLHYVRRKLVLYILVTPVPKGARPLGQSTTTPKGPVRR
jgi:hypothetical protein